MVIEKQNPNAFTTELSFFFNPNKHFHISILHKLLNSLDWFILEYYYETCILHKSYTIKVWYYKVLFKTEMFSSPDPLK